MDRADVVVIGGGIAGLATAYHLARAGAGSVALLEGESALATQSSGRNAAIFRLLEPATGLTTLAVRSRVLLDELMGGRERWLRSTGVLFVAAGADRLGELSRLARRAGVHHALLGQRQIEAIVPLLRGGDCTSGLFVPEAGVIDIHAVTTRLAEVARAAGVRVATGRRVGRVLVRSDRVDGVELESGGRIVAGAVVIAAGAWSIALGATCGAEVPLVPFRRHLVHLGFAEVLRRIPVVWRLDDQVYFRGEGDGLLASPCDEEAWPAEAPPLDVEAPARLAQKLERLAPGLGHARVHRVWACLRTFAPDRTLLAGPDERVAGLHWLAGLGGSGMTVGLAAGEIVAAGLRGEAHPLNAVLSPARSFDPSVASWPTTGASLGRDA